MCLRVPCVLFDNHLFRRFDPRPVVAHRGTGNQAPVFENRRDLNERPIHLAQESVFHVLRDVAEVDVHIVHLTRVDPFARFRIRLIRQPELDAAGHGQRPIQLRSRGSARENADLSLLAAQVCVRDAPRQRQRHRLRITGAREPTHADLSAELDQRRRLFGAHDAGRQAGIQNSRSDRRKGDHRISHDSQGVAKDLRMPLSTELACDLGHKTW